jgi:hypothetical protein
MECYRRAMLGEQSFEGRRENLNQANKLSRSYAVLLDALVSDKFSHAALLSDVHLMRRMA